MSTSRILSASIVFAALTAISPVYAVAVREVGEVLPEATRISHVNALAPVSDSFPHFTPSIIGDTIFDSAGFNSYATGNLVGQNTWVAYTGATAANYQVNATAGVGGTPAVRLTGTSSTQYSNWSFPDPASNAALPYTTGSGETISVNVDMGRTVASTAANSASQYAVDVYSSTNQITKFGLNRQSSSSLGLFVTAPFNTATSEFEAGAPLFNVTIATGLTPGSLYNLEAVLNFATGTWDLYSGGVLFEPGIPFASAAAGDTLSTDFSDADLYVGSGRNLDVGVFDNYRVTAVPEPTSIAALALCGLALIHRRRD